MSFGYGVGDVLVVAQFSWNVYKACKDAPAGYSQVSQEVLSMNAVLREAEDILSNCNLTASQQIGLKTVTDGCQDVLRDLQDIITRYESLSTQFIRTRDRMGWISANVTELRARLVSNSGLLTSFLSTLQVVVQQKLHKYLRKVQREEDRCSRMTIESLDSLSTDGKYLWRRIRKDLEDVGITLAAFDANREYINAWFKEALAKGAFATPGPESRYGKGGTVHPAYRTTAKDMNRTLPAVADDNSSTTLTIHTVPAPPATPPATPEARSPRSVPLLAWNAARLARESAKEIRPGGIFDKTAGTGTYGKAQVFPEGCGSSSVYSDSTGLHAAVEQDDGEKIRLLLRSGVDVNTCLGCQAVLHMVVESSNTTLMQLLLDYGANLDERDSNGETPLLRAARKGQLTACKWLLARRANVNAANHQDNTALHIVAELSIPSVMKSLLGYRADVNLKNKDGLSALDILFKSTVPSQGQRKAMLQLLVDHGLDLNLGNSQGLTLLHRAVEKLEVDKSESLLECGADANAKAIPDIGLGYRIRPLDFAVSSTEGIGAAIEERREAVVLALLKYGAVIENNTDGTALHVAVERRSIEMVKLLLNHGAKTEAKDRARHTPLYRAIVVGDIDIARMLVQHSADVNCKNYVGETALHVAAGRFGTEDFVQLLLNNGASTAAVDRQGRTPIDCANAEECYTNARLLDQRVQSLSSFPIRSLSPLSLSSHFKRESSSSNGHQFLTSDVGAATDKRAVQAASQRGSISQRRRSKELGLVPKGSLSSTVSLATVHDIGAF